MTTTKMPLFTGLDALATQAKVQKPVDRAQLDVLAADNGFPSREPVATEKLPATGQLPGVGKPPGSHERPRLRRRYTTGRNVQLNIKATSATVQRMGELADELGVPLGVVLERALNALEASGAK
jgi:hypothetical protein